MNDYFDRIEGHLLAAVERNAAGESLSAEGTPGGAREARRVRAPKGALVLAGVLGSAAAVLLGLQGLTANEGPAGVSPAVAAALSRVARVAAAQAAPTPTAGKYILDVSETRGRRISRGCPVSIFGRSELWIGANGSGFSRSTVYPPRSLSLTSRESCASVASKLGRKEEAGVTEVGWAPHCLDREKAVLQRLPLGVGAMRRSLVSEARRADGAWVEGRLSSILFGRIADLLQEGIATPAQRADLYKVAGTLPGVALIASVHDPLGRPGVAVSARGQGGRIRMIFDPKTSALLALVVSNQSPSGVMESTWRAYLQPRAVDALPEGSPRNLKPACTAANHYQINSARIKPHLWVQRGAKP